MEKEFAEQMKEALITMKKEIIDSLAANNEEFKAIAGAEDPKDSVDMAADDIDRKLLESLSAKDLKRMQLIDSALRRIDAGKYGVCIKCGKKIPAERLKAIPYALMCVQCQSADERRNR